MKTLRTTAVASGMGLLSVLAGCVSHQQATRLDTPRPQLVCIVKHEAVRPTFLEVLQEGLTNHGVETKVVPGTYTNNGNRWMPRWRTDDVKDCDALMFYVANWHWDLALYMYFANIWMTTPDGARRLAQAKYDASNNIGVGKFINGRTKILELVDQMVPHYGPLPPVRPAKLDTPTTTNAASAPAQTNAAVRLEQLEELKKKGLITDDEYQKKRQEILSGI